MSAALWIGFVHGLVAGLLAGFLIGRAFARTQQPHEALKILLKLDRSRFDHEMAKARRVLGIIAGLLLAFLWSDVSLAADLCRDGAGRFTACPEEVSEPEVVPERSSTPAPITDEVTGRPRFRASIAAGALTAVTTDASASVEPLAMLSVEAPLSTSPRGPALEVHAALTALPDETLDLSDPQTFKAIEMSIGLSQPIHPSLLFRLYADGGFASRLATTEDPVARLPGWWSAGFLFRTADRGHWLKVGLGGDQRLSGAWAAAVHVSGQAKVGERGGVSLYLVGSLIRALDLSAYGYAPPARDALRLGVAVGM